MQIPQLTKYILEEIEQGTPELAIKQKLFASKWMPEQIEENYQYALLEAQNLLSKYQKKQTTPPIKILVRVMAVFIGLLIISGVSLFVYLVVHSLQQQPAADLVQFPTVSTTPLPTEKPIVAVVNESDRARERDRLQIKTALFKYYEDKRIYPPRLSELATSYLAVIPRDPVTSNPYKYEPLSESQDYKLCITYEEVGEICFNRLSN